MGTLEFVKMHGLGNDYVLINCFEQRVDEPETLAREVSQRRFGIGSDGLILLLPPERPDRADVRMRMFNADGSEAEMCGNGIRCVCKLAHDDGMVRRRPMRVQTGAGVRELHYTVDAGGKVDRVTVDMGEPVTNPARLPIDRRVLRGEGPEYALDVDGRTIELTVVSMGNPHALVFCESAESVDLARLGPAVERHAAFPERINVHFAQVDGPGELTMRTWERGSGSTAACGTGASAACVAGVLTGRCGRRVQVHLPGGELDVEWDRSTGHVQMSGPATELFRGRWQGRPAAT